MKQEPIKRGPVSIAADASWESFLALLAGAVVVPVEYLPVNSFAYHLSVPANSPKVPVVTETGFMLMLQELHSQVMHTKKPLPLVILHFRMPPIVTH